MKKLYLILLIIPFITHCKKVKSDKEQIEDYVSANKLNGTYTSSGLFYTIETPGTGGFPTINSTVKVEYAGYLLNGSKFDATEAGKNIEFPLTDVILGWQEGIPKYQKGGKGKLIIPSSLGYGSRDLGVIPPNSVLVFDVTLVDWR